MPSATLERTPLHALHAELGARFTPFAGYEMPIQYREGLRTEHLHTRSHAGLFDVSHMGQVRVTGRGLEAALERALPLDFDGWPEGAQRYSLLLNERGGIEDDLMVTRLADEVRIVVNAAGKEKDLTLLPTLCPDLSFTLLDDALIALQGPAAEGALPAARTLAFLQSRTGWAGWWGGREWRCGTARRSSPAMAAKPASSRAALSPRQRSARSCSAQYARSSARMRRSSPWCAMRGGRCALRNCRSCRSATRPALSRAAVSGRRARRPSSSRRAGPTRATPTARGRSDR